MHPIICTIGPFTIYSYGLMLALAFIIGQHLAVRQAAKDGLDPAAIFNFLFLSVSCGILGARLLYIGQNLSFYLVNPGEIIMLQHGGLSWFGGLFFGSASGICYLAKKKLPISQTLDLVAPYLALAQAIGRIGCFLNGCCFGKDSIPTQIYSSLLLFGIFFSLILIRHLPHKKGEIFFTYLLLYSLKRFFIEFWRGDNPVIFWGLTLFQLLSAVLFFLALVGLVVIKDKSGHYH
jgi:phosphatidylglycerol:prolipoprotein diacylglycerol transferase